MTERIYEEARLFLMEDAPLSEPVNRRDIDAVVAMVRRIDGVSYAGDD